MNIIFQYRIRSIEYITNKLEAAGVPVMLPAGGHAVYLDAKAFLDHIPSAPISGTGIGRRFVFTRWHTSR
jgi:tryptophanase